MSALGRLVLDAISSWHRGELPANELARWSRDQSHEYVRDHARRYAFRDDVALEALGLLAGCVDLPEPDEEIAAASALLRGELPFQASRLLLVDPEWVDAGPTAPVSKALRDAADQLARGDDWSVVVRRLGGPLATVAGLGGNDYVELLLLEAAAVVDDLRLAVHGTVEVLGKGRPRVDAGLVAERLGAIGQVLAGDRPLRAFVRGRGETVDVVLSY